MQDSSDASEATRHYDTVVEAWAYLLGEDLHYGYFASGEETLAQATDALTNQMLHLAQLGPGLKALDIGCGTGRAGCRIAGEYDTRVVGISPSVACIEKASARAAGLGLSERASFCPGDGTALQFESASFDRVWVMESSHLMDDKPALLAECARVLKPGGRVVLCDLMLARKLSLQQVIAYRDEFLLLKDAFGRARMETLAFYREELEAHGLVVEEARSVTAETLPTFARWRDNAGRNRAEVEGLIGQTAWRQFLDSCTVLESFWRNDIMGYGILCATRPPQGGNRPAVQN